MRWSPDQMMAFQAVATYGSFSKAAVSLSRSQSSISVQVSKLEESLGKRLFDRTTKRIRLTDAGQILLLYVTQIERLMQQALQELDDLDHLERGRLVICTSDTTGCYYLPPLLQRYRQRHPGIDIVVRNATSPETIQAVRHHEVDLGIVTLPANSDDLVIIPLFSRHDVLIGHPQHPLAQRTSVSLQEIVSYPIILLDKACASRRIIDEVCAQAQVHLQISMELRSIEVIKRFVRIDAGLSIVPAMAIREDVAAGVLASVDVSDFANRALYQMGIIYKKNRYLSHAAQSFLEALRAYTAVESDEGCPY
jgi:DNA-binding transcriptional LysR family regulator